MEDSDVAIGGDGVRGSVDTFMFEHWKACNEKHTYVMSLIQLQCQLKFMKPKYIYSKLWISENLLTWMEDLDAAIGDGIKGSVVTLIFEDWRICNVKHV